MNLNLTLFTQGVAFFLFILFTYKFVWPPLMRVIEQRQKVIAEGLAAAEQGKQSLERSARQVESDLRSARERAGEIVALAEKRAAQIVDEAKNDAREEAGREKAAARAEIEQEISRAREGLRGQVAGLVVAGAEKILRREVDPKAHAELLEQLKREI